MSADTHGYLESAIVMRSNLHAILFLVASFVGTWLLFVPAGNPWIQGQVWDEAGPLSGVSLHFQGRQDAVFSDALGRFRIARLEPFRPLVAIKPGYRIEATDAGDAVAGDAPLDIRMIPLPKHDNEDYAWIDPYPHRGKVNNCGNCHGEIFREWRGSGHARSARNPRFLEMVDGQDAAGTSWPTWNLGREHPLGVGVCALCHVPAQDDRGLDREPRKVSGVAAHGTHCDYCHKIVDAPTDKLGTRFGRDGLRLLRPATGEALFFGPLDDAVRPGESFGYPVGVGGPLYKESRYCASCHEGVIFGVHVYGTYSEWRDSPARRRGQQCQTCHMAPTGKMTNIAPRQGGIERPPQTLASHHFPGNQPDMLKRSLNVAVVSVARRDGLQALVALQAVNVGHRMPTGFIDRNLVLVVEGLDAKGVVTKLHEGPRLPAHAGRQVAGLPGYLFAKQLFSAEGKAPLPFWAPHDRVLDTRLAPGRAETFSFVFSPETKTIRARLLYRRFWPELADPRGWHDNETVVLERLDDVADGPPLGAF